MNTPKTTLRPAEFAEYAVTVGLARGLNSEGLKEFLNSTILWRGLHGHMKIYALHEAVALKAVRPDELLVELLGTEVAAALTADKRRELRGRMKAANECRSRATKALLLLIETQIEACDNAGPTFKQVEADRTAAYLTTDNN